VTDAVFTQGVHIFLTVSAALICVWRTAVGPRDRGAWASFAVALGTYAAAEIVWRALYRDLDSPPYPSVADALWPLFYPASYAGLVLLVRGRTVRFSPSLWLDGLVGGLAVATLGAAIVFKAVLSETGGSPSAVGVTLAYPLGDLMLLGFVVAAFALTGWRPGTGGSSSGSAWPSTAPPTSSTSTRPRQGPSSRARSSTPRRLRDGGRGPPSRGARPLHPHHRDDRSRDGGRPREVPRRRDGRLPVEAAGRSSSRRCCRAGFRARNPPSRSPSRDSSAAR